MKSINEVLKFDRKNFLAELAKLMVKYKVNLVNDVEGAYFEDQYGNTVLDITDKFYSPAAMMKVAANSK